jgi:hypothetical protein
MQPPLRTTVHRCLLAALCAGLLLATIAPPMRAQDTAAPPHRTPRRKILAIVGGIAGGLLGFGITRTASGGSKGGCAGIPCLVIGSTAAGAALGYLIGRDYDRTYMERYRGVAPLHISSTAADLEGEPVALAVADSTVAVAGSAGVLFFGSTAGDLRDEARRAGGLRGISVVALAPHTEWLAVGSPVGLYLFPPHTGPGALMREGDVGAVTATSTMAYAAMGDRLVAVPLSSDTAQGWTSHPLGSPARDLAVDSARALLWAVTDRDLASYRISGDSLTRLGAAPLGAAGRRLALANDTIAVALGEQGVRLFDVTDPAAPRPLMSWSVAHFVYDVSIDRGRIFAAAGPEGVYVLVVRAGALHSLGLARSLGFASALASQGGYTYILDRRTNSLRRIRSDF